MEVAFEHLRTTRAQFLALVNGLDEDRLNYQPPGFSNNIVWHLGHIVVTQQLLTYGLAGLEGPSLPLEARSFRKGSRPERRYTQAEIDRWAEAARWTPDKLEEDYRQGRFVEFRPYQTSFGAALHSIEEAIAFDTLHEALHLGYAMGLRKALKNAVEPS